MIDPTGVTVLFLVAILFVLLVIAAANYEDKHHLLEKFWQSLKTKPKQHPETPKSKAP